MTRVLFLVALLVMVSGCVTIVPEADNQLPSASIDSIVPGQALNGEPVTFSGHGTDTDGTITTYQWRSDIDDKLSSQAGFTISSLSTGSHTIYFKVQDDKGDWSGEVRMRIVITDKAAGEIPDSSTGSGIQVLSPLSGERFVKGEAIEFRVKLDDHSAVDGQQLQWISDIDGTLGTGLKINPGSLSVGTHSIEIKGYGYQTSVTVRVLNDLWELYESPPSQAEIDRILSDFHFIWVDGSLTDEKWDTYKSFNFNQKSPDPSKVVAIARLDILRHQRFSQPLAFTGGKTAYDHLKKFVTTIRLRLDCSYNTAGSGTINLNRNFSVWDIRKSGTMDNPHACKLPLDSPPGLDVYSNSLYLLLHEGRHCEPDDPGHMTCDGKSNMDTTLENGSGHAQAALYLMWVYKYGLYDPEQVKSTAKVTAESILVNRFCSQPAHSNPKVEDVLNELQ